MIDGKWSTLTFFESMIFPSCPCLEIGNAVSSECKRCRIWNWLVLNMELQIVLLNCSGIQIVLTGVKLLRCCSLFLSSICDFS
jgi:hypothetical protein